MLTSPRTVKISLFFVAGFVFVAGGVLVSGQHLSVELGIAVSIITFIYGFFLNFMLNLAQNKFFRFMQAFGEFSGSLINFYKLVELCKDKKLTVEAKSVVTALLERLDYLVPERYSATNEEYFKLYAIAGKVKASTKEKHNYLNRILAALHEIGKTREVMETYANSYLRKGLTEVYWVLSAVFLVTLILIVSSWQIFIFSAMLTFLIVFISLVIRDIDNLHYGEEAIRHASLSHLQQMVNGKKK